MRNPARRLLLVGFALSAVVAAGCTTSNESKPAAVDTAAPVATATVPADSGAMTNAAPAATPATTTPAASTLRVEVDLSARQLALYEGQNKLETHGVAVGSAEWPTQTGEWTIKQVVFNPEWIPPDESWAEERKPRKPGDPLNPLGRAQLVYDPPRTVHGTNQPASIGKNVSHGSIRMNNAEIVALAKRIMEASGAQKDAAWYQSAERNKSEKQIVDLPRPVPIKVF